MNWLRDLTDWLRDQILAIWAAVVAFFERLVITLLEAVLELGALAIEAVPVPAFLGDYSIGQALGNAGPEVAWVVSTFRIGEGMAIISAAIVFRITRKLITFGRW